MQRKSLGVPALDLPETRGIAVCVCLLGLPPDFPGFKIPRIPPFRPFERLLRTSPVTSDVSHVHRSPRHRGRRASPPRRFVCAGCSAGNWTAAGDRCWLGCVVWGPDGVGRSARSAPRCRFWERSRLGCSHRARPRSPRPGASKPDRSDGHQWAPHLIDGQERNSRTKACIVYHVHLSLRHRHRRAFPPNRFVSPGSAPVHAWAAWRAGTSGDRAGLVRSVGRAWDAPRPRVLSHRSRGVQISAQLSGWSLR